MLESLHFTNMHLKLTILALLISFSIDVSLSRSLGSANLKPQTKVSRKIIVDKSGHGDFATVQDAIDSVPPNNKEWVGIILNAEVYNEKVLIPKEKPYIVLEGQGRRKTIIQYGDSGSSLLSSTFTVLAQQFVARNISFKNTYGRMIPRKFGVPMTWAPAVRVGGDKCSFYQCEFLGLQDIVTDEAGRHYFESCHIEGEVDFIWGLGQSYYQNCHISVNNMFMKSAPSYITANARKVENEPGGFVFNYGTVVGNGTAYLGRAYNQYSRVLFHRTHMSAVVLPRGWDIWLQKGKESTVTYSENLCFGPGSVTSKRVSWEKQLSEEEWDSFTNVTTFIDQDGWIDSQPQYPIL